MRPLLREHSSLSRVGHALTQPRQLKGSELAVVEVLYILDGYPQPGASPLVNPI